MDFLPAIGHFLLFILYDFSRVQDQFIIESQFYSLMKLIQPGTDEIFKILQPAVADAMFSGKLSSELFGNRVEFFQTGVSSFSQSSSDIPSGLSISVWMFPSPQ